MGRKAVSSDKSWRPPAWKPLGAALAVALFPFLAPGTALCDEDLSVTIMRSNLGAALSLEGGYQGSTKVGGLAATVSQYVTYGAETKERGIKTGALNLQLGVDALSLPTGRMGGVEAEVIWLTSARAPHITPYFGGGGGVTWEITKGSPGCPTCEHDSGPQPRVGAVVGLAFVGGWAASEFKTIWFVEGRSTRYLGTVARSEILVRQGIRWLLF